MQVGDVADLHAYPGPGDAAARTVRARAARRVRRLGLPLDGTPGSISGNWGYRSFTSLDEIEQRLPDLLAQLRLHEGDGLAGAIYTQTTDVEIEVNGVMTYDRAVVKLSPSRGRPTAHVRDGRPRITHLVAASDRRRRRGVHHRAPAPLVRSAFDDAAWQRRGRLRRARHAFARAARMETPDIWLRRRRASAAPRADTIGSFMTMTRRCIGMGARREAARRQRGFHLR
jgi:hypothetical protein